MPGSIIDDFAGTLDEARAFAKENGMCAPQNRPYKEASTANGCACISVPYKNDAERVVAIQKMESLGWESGAWFDSRHNK